MKTSACASLITLLAFGSIHAQTADQWVAQGRTNLCAHNLPAAYARFQQALQADPAHPDANLLAAATRLLLLPQQPAVSNALNRLGISKTGRDPYTWTADFTRDANDNVVFPVLVNTSEAVPLVRNELLPALRAAGTNLARITNTNFLIALDACETGTEPATLDYGDVQMLRALVKGAECLGHTLGAHNSSVVVNRIQTLGTSNALSISRLLAEYPSLLALVSKDELTQSQSALTNGIALYFAASEWIRLVRVPGADRLFTLDPTDVESVQEEEQFRVSLTNLLASLNGPVKFDDQDDHYVYAGAYFEGTKSVRSLLPKFDGDRYLPNTLPDYTLGGALVGVDSAQVESFLRENLGQTSAGYYWGDIEDWYYHGGTIGGLTLFVRTNNQATLAGGLEPSWWGTPLDAFPFFDESFTVGDDGWWYVDRGSWGHEGQISEDAGPYGRYFSGWIWLNDPTYGYLYYYFSGFSLPLDGPYAKEAGYYSGTWSGSGQSGQLRSIIDPDGIIYYFVLLSSGQVIDLGGADLPSPPSSIVEPFFSLSYMGDTVEGALNRSTLTITGMVYTAGGDTVRFNLTRKATIAPPPTLQPPAIVQQPSDLTVVAATTATLSVKAAGAAPLYYQWWHNGLPVWKATSPTLTIANFGYEDAGEYWVTVGNPSATTNSQSAQLTVLPETSSPVVAITSPLAGGRISNIVTQVSGTARDNQAVALVEVRLNGGAWESASTSNGWTNWTAIVQPLNVGTNNRIEARATDTSGNLSPTASRVFTYVLSAPLTVNTVGNGKVTGATNGQWFEIGKPLTLGTLPGPGWILTNWLVRADGSPVLSTNKPVQFVMQSNLVLTATFADVAKPVITITAPTLNQRWSNEMFTVRGRETDNNAEGTVHYQLNGGAWTNANGWTNWQAEVRLVPGTNNVKAYAMDAAGNRSVTNSVNFIRVLTAPLGLEIVGGGKVNGATNGQPLEIGRPITLTVTPNTGWILTNWLVRVDGSPVISTNKAVPFLMASNLVLTATFADVTRPVVAVLKPVTGSRLTNASVTLIGKATDNSGQIAAVHYQLNTNDWALASGTTNWSAALTLQPGLNTVLVYAVDPAGLRSLTNRWTATYVSYDRLRVEIAGKGTISPNWTNTLLEVAKPYTLTALPGAGQVFSNWMRLAPSPTAVLTNQPLLRFVMESNLVLRANFVTNPFIALKGTYRGLFFPTNGLVEVTNAGFLSLILTDKGLGSGSVLLAGRAYAFSGLAFDLEGWASRRVLRTAPLAPLDLELELDLQDPMGVVEGSVSSAGWEAEILAYRTVGDTNRAGLYTFVLPGSEVTDTNQPVGYGAGTMTVDKLGGVRLAGQLGEGSVLSVGSGMSGDGWCPVYAPLYGGRGMLLGWVRFEGQKVSGTPVWLKAQAISLTDKYYRGGFAVNTELWGARYVAPLLGQPIVGWTNGVVVIEGGNLSQGISNGVKWVSNKLVLELPNTNKVVLTVTPSSGLWSGSFMHPDRRLTTVVRGALLQGPGWGAGWFLGTNQSGRVLIEQSPATNPP